MNVELLLAFVIGAAIPVVIDVAGHAMNRRLLLRAHTRLDHADERAERVGKRVEEIASAFNDLVKALQEQPVPPPPSDGLLNGGVDPRAAVEAREQKKLERKMARADAESMIIEHVGATKYAVVKKLLPDIVEDALSSGNAQLALPIIERLARGVDANGGKVAASVKSSNGSEGAWR